MPTIIENLDAPTGLGTPYTLNVGDTFSGSVAGADEVDRVLVDLVAGQTYTVVLTGLYGGVSPGVFSVGNYDAGVNYWSVGYADGTLNGNIPGVQVVDTGSEWYVTFVAPLTGQYSLFVDDNGDPFADAYSMSILSGAVSPMVSPTSGNDVVTGSSGSDSLSLLAGDDLFTDAGGDDSVQGGSGEDTLQGGAGNDTLRGGVDDDLLQGGDNDDELRGGAGSDTLSGDDGADELRGGGGNDDLDGGSGNDNLFGDGGADTLAGGIGDDQLRGGSGNDSLDGGADSDLLRGGGGNDTLLGGTGTDDLHGETGNDDLDGGAGNDTLDGDQGNDTLSGGDGDDVLQGGSGDDLVEGGANNDVVSGGDDNDTLTGGSGADTLNGESGNDELSGGAENDSLDGGIGDDTLDGGLGDDQLRGGAGNDVFVIDGSGVDILVDFTIGSDTIDLSGFAAGSTYALAGDGGGNTILSVNGTHVATLSGLDVSALSGTDFIAPDATITFDGGTVVGSTYQENGFSANFFTFAAQTVSQNPFQDIDGDGEIDFGVTDNSAGVTNIDAFAWIEFAQDNGDTFDFVDFDITGEGGTDGDGNLILTGNNDTSGFAVTATYLENGDGLWDLQVRTDFASGFVSFDDLTQEQMLAHFTDLDRLYIRAADGDGRLAVDTGNGIGVDDLIFA